MTDERPDPDLRAEDTVPEDDAIIGRAFRGSLVVLVLVGVAVAVGVWLTRPRAETEAVLAKQVGEVADIAAPASAMPAVEFRDVTREAGIDFRRTSGARGEKLLPETMGGGVAFLDYDTDGDPDLLFVNGQDWPWSDERSRPGQALYRNDGAGRFDDVSVEAGLDFSFYGMGVAVGDYDGDGDPDLFLTAVGENRLLENRAGTFRDVTRSAGVGGDPETWSTSAGFFDYDGDGDLDLFVCNYVRWSREIDIRLNFTLNGTDRAYGPPTNYEGVHPYLYRNDGGGRFTDVSEASGVRVTDPLSGRPMAKALALGFVDVDRDGHLDVLVANDTVQNFLLRNRGDGTFEEIGATSGVGFDGSGNSTGAMGLDVAHYRNDFQLAVGIANFANEMTSLYVSQRADLLFTDEAAGEGIGSPSRRFLSFGLFFFDYDLDGRLDLLQANGHLEEEIAEVQSSQTYRQRAQLFWNQGADARSCFAEVPPESTGDLARPIVGRGAAYADIDADGDLDVVVTQTEGAPLLLRNEQRTGHRRLRIRLVDSGSNTAAIGAWVKLVAGGMTQRRQVMPTRSYLSQVEPELTFGLGGAEAVDAAEVVWPDGSVQPFEVGELDRTIEVARQGRR